MIPTTVEAAAIKPTVDMGTPKERMNNGNAEFLAIVELKMANPPIIHKSRNGEILIFNYLPLLFGVITDIDDTLDKDYTK